MALMRARHNALAEVETFCTGTVAKLERYAPLLAHVAKRKAKIRQEMSRLERHAGDARD